MSSLLKAFYEKQVIMNNAPIPKGFLKRPGDCHGPFGPRSDRFLLQFMENLQIFSKKGGHLAVSLIKYYGYKYNGLLWAGLNFGRSKFP